MKKIDNCFLNLRVNISHDQRKGAAEKTKENEGQRNHDRNVELKVMLCIAFGCNFSLWSTFFLKYN